MNTNNTILLELEPIAPSLVSISRSNLYNLPAGYFENLAYSILSRVKEKEPEFNSASNPFTVPQGYFEGLSQSILNKISSDTYTRNDVEEELNEIAPLLNTINKQPVFSVPAGYFESILPLSAVKPSSKVITPFRFTKFIRYAAAAIITGLIATGGVLFLNKPDTIADPPVAKIQEYHPEDVQKLSEADINEFLDTHGSATDVASIANTLDSDDMDMENRIEDISDSELQQYLKDNPEPGS